MGLKDLQLPTASVEIPGGSFAVRGLSPVEIEQLVREHRATLGALFDQFKGQLANPEADLMASGAELLVQAPELMARVICMAADEPDSIDMAMRLPTSVQFAALGKIAALTFTVEGDLGKLVATALTKIGGLNGLLELVSQALASLKKS